MDQTATTGKKQQAASASAAVQVDDHSIAAALDDNEEALAPVCPVCSKSTESSQLDGTRTCEGWYRQQIVHLSIAR